MFDFRAEAKETRQLSFLSLELDERVSRFKCMIIYQLDA